jgi:hypothetical protein
VGTQIIGLTGLAGSGKSVAAQHLMDDHGFERIKFAGTLKAMLMGYYRELGLSYPEINRRIEGDLKEVDDPYLGGRTPRHAMQSLGTEWGRDCMRRDFWIEAWRIRVLKSQTSVVVDDVRFDNEANTIRSMGGLIIQLEPAEVRRNASDHKSESGIHPSLIDATIKNDGTLQDLRVSVSKVVSPEFGTTFGPL